MKISTSGVIRCIPWSVAGLIVGIGLLTVGATGSRATDAYLVHDVTPAARSSNRGTSVVYQDTFVFTGKEAGGTFDIWASDGSHGGTFRALDLAGECVPVYRLRTTCFPHCLVRSRDYLYFDLPTGLWRTDLTRAGTVRVADVNLYESGEYDHLFAAPTDVQGTLFFVADIEDTLPNGELTPRSLWKTRGTAATTRRVRDFPATPRNLMGAGGRLYFSVRNEGASMDEFWRSDGTAGGTVLIAGFRRVGEGVDIGTTLVLAAADGPRGTELWKASGPTVSLVKDIVPGPVGSGPTGFVELGGTALFLVETPEDTTELWRTDGTPEGTFSPPPGFPEGEYGSLTRAGSRVLAWGPGGLWSSDGTSGGTTLLLADPDVGDDVWPDEILGLHEGILFFATPRVQGVTRLGGLPVPDDFQDDVILDNGAPGTTAFKSWSVSRAPDPYGSTSLWSRAASATSVPPEYRYSADLLSATYEVFEWHTVLSTRASAVPYVIRGSIPPASTTVLVDQRKGGGRWNSLGSRRFAGASQVSIFATDHVGSTCADAIWFHGTERTLPGAAIDGIDPAVSMKGASPVTFRGHGVPAAPSLGIEELEWTSDLQPGLLIGTATSFSLQGLVPGQHTITLRARDVTGAWSRPARGTVEILESSDAIIDDASAAAAATGFWGYSGAPGSFGASSRFARSASGTGNLKFTFSVTLPAGRYEVLEWHTIWPTRSRSVPHRITSASGTSTSVTVDQSVNGGKWNSLGVFALSGASAVTIVAIDTAASTNADAVRFLRRS